MTWMIESVREADVEPDAVYRLYADPGTWARWGHNATWARSTGPLVQGGTVEVRAGYGTVYRCRIRRLEPGRALELVVRPAGLTIINIYEVTPVDAGARVRHALIVSGQLAGITRRTIRSMYQRKLDDEVAAVLAMARDPASTETGRPVPSVSPPERLWHALGRALRGGRAEQRP